MSLRGLPGTWAGTTAFAGVIAPIVVLWVLVIVGLGWDAENCRVFTIRKGLGGFPVGLWVALECESGAAVAGTGAGAGWPTGCERLACGMGAGDGSAGKFWP